MTAPKSPGLQRRCIYCGATNCDLSREHVVPLAFNGFLTMPKASCKACRDITSSFEGTVARGMYQRLRARFKTRTRRPDKRPAAFVLEVTGPHGNREIGVPSEIYPRIYPAFRLPLPGILCGREPVDADKDPVQISIELRGQGSDVNELYKRGFLEPDETLAFPAVAHWGDFSRFVAKIAHCYTMWFLGEGVFEPALVPMILGTNTHLSYWIGGYDVEPVERYVPAWLETINLNDELYIKCSVFLLLSGEHAGFPVYQAVVGRVINAPLFEERAALKSVRKGD